MKKIFAILVASIMVATMFAPTALAQDIDVEAAVSNAGSPPVINYQWALSVNETDMSIVPGDDLVPHSDTKTQVMPIAGDGLTVSEKHFKKYAVVSHPNGIAYIATVYEQLRNQTGVAMGPEVVMTDITSDVTQWTNAINQAYLMNLISEPAKIDMLDLLRSDKGGYRIFVIDNYLTNHDTPGDYQVYFKVVDNGGAYLENTNVTAGGPGALLVEYMSLKAFQTDFGSINYGTIIVNTNKQIAGDEDWSTPLRPTIKNQGNVPVQMNVSASNLTGENAPSQTIPATALSAHLLSHDISSLSIAPQTFNNPIMPCTPTQIDFDITAPFGTSANTYTGTLTLEMV